MYKKANLYLLFEAALAVIFANASLAAPVTIDYAIFYTPNARIQQGSTASIEARIESAFRDANEIFTLSGSEIIHRVVHMKELPLNNTSDTLPELGTELALGFDFNSVMTQANADSMVIIVEFQRPGGFAIIPNSRRQALSGGKINLGLPNLSGSILAHEIGHTLGSGHDYSDVTSSFFDILPEYGAGNHFIGANTGKCYKTIMSALTACRVPGHEGENAIASNRFSSSKYFFDGTLTGDPIKADNVKAFEYFGPLVASARGDSQLPVDPAPTATPTNGGGDDDGDDVGEEMPDTWDMLTLTLGKNRGKIFLKGKCVSGMKAPLTGDKISLHIVNKNTGAKTRVKRTNCRSTGRFEAEIRRKGSYQAKNDRTGRESQIVKYR